MTALTHKENDLHNRLIVAEFNLGQVEEELRRLHEENKALRARLAQPENAELPLVRAEEFIKLIEGKENFRGIPVMRTEWPTRREQ